MLRAFSFPVPVVKPPAWRRMADLCGGFGIPVVRHLPKYEFASTLVCMLMTVSAKCPSWPQPHEVTTQAEPMFTLVRDLVAGQHKTDNVGGKWMSGELPGHQVGSHHAVVLHARIVQLLKLLPLSCRL